jgi:hypothetical protein
VFGYAIRRTLWEEPIVARLCVLPQKPAVAKVIVTLDKLNAVSAPQAKLVGAPSQELVCGFRSVTAIVSSVCRRLTDDDECVAGLARLGMRSLHVGEGSAEGGGGWGLVGTG